MVVSSLIWWPWFTFPAAEVKATAAAATEVAASNDSTEQEQCLRVANNVSEKTVMIKRKIPVNKGGKRLT